MGKKNARQRKHEFEANKNYNNVTAIQEGPKRKKWSHHDLKTVKPLTDTQEEMFQAWFQGSNICAHGSAGTGKTFLSFFLALNEIFMNQQQEKIIIIRSVVPTREVGHLPGTLEEKTAVYELPYHDICWELIGRKSTYIDMKEAGLIDFQTTSFIRGMTWDNAVVIVEEAENMTFHEIDSVMTRLGVNSRVIFTGDLVQTDLDGRKSGVCGMQRLLNVCDEMKEFATVNFGVDDIVRSALVKSWIIASQRIAA